MGNIGKRENEPRLRPRDPMRGRYLPRSTNGLFQPTTRVSDKSDLSDGSDGSDGSDEANREPTP